MQLFNKISKKSNRHNFSFFNKNNVFCNFTAKLYQFFNTHIAIIFHILAIISYIIKITGASYGQSAGTDRTSFHSIR